MKIPYRKVDFVIQFEHPVQFKNFPIVILRSVLGMQLRRLVCLFKEKRCVECSLKMQCAYSWLFETPIEKNAQTLFGRERAPHPFVFSFIDDFQKPLRQLSFSLTVLGKAIEYFPYIFLALQKVGEVGIFRERYTFIIVQAVSDAESIILTKDEIDTQKGIKTWHFETDVPEQKNNTNININFIVPCRIQIKEKIQKDFTYQDLLNKLYARAKTLCEFFGDGSMPTQKFIDADEQLCTVKNLRWKTYNYFSTRQQEEVILDGVIGIMNITGKISNKEVALLENGQLFHTGKSVAFGLGKILITKPVL